MFRTFSSSQIPLSLGILAGNFFVHHRHQIRVKLDMEPQPVNPDVTSDPPEQVFDPEVEKNIDAFTSEIEKYTEKKKPVAIAEQLEYKGDFTKDKKTNQVIPNGKGVYYSNSNQFKMVGVFKDGVVNGPAYFRYPDGSMVKTNFNNGEIKGQGVRYLEGMKFEGNLVDGKPKGQGLYTFDESEKIYVKQDGETEQAKCYDKDGRLWYKGEYKDGQCEGHGEFFYKNGNKYEGDFKGGKMEGLGVLRDPYGDVIYKGVFNRDQPSTIWKLYKEPGIAFIVILANVAPLLMKR